MALNRRRHLRSAGRPSRWALAHILVVVCSSSVSVLHRLWNTTTFRTQCTWMPWNYSHVCFPIRVQTYDIHRCGIQTGFTQLTWPSGSLKVIGISKFDRAHMIFGRPFVKRFVHMLPDRCLSVCLSVLSVTLVYILWPNGWMDQDETWHAGRPWPWPHCVRWGPSSPPPKGRSPLIFGLRLLWPNGCTD